MSTHRWINVRLYWCAQRGRLCMCLYSCICVRLPLCHSYETNRNICDLCDMNVVSPNIDYVTVQMNTDFSGYGQFENVHEKPFIHFTNIELLIEIWLYFGCDFANFCWINNFITKFAVIFSVICVHFSFERRLVGIFGLIERCNLLCEWVTDSDTWIFCIC